MIFLGPLPLLLIILIVAIFLVLAGSGRTRPTGRGDMPKACPGCGGVHPAHANFCRRCGQRLV
jgi:hypothetical protein